MENYQEQKERTITELKRLIEMYSGKDESPRAVGGPYNLTPEEMLREVENNTVLGKQIVSAFELLKSQFPPKS